MKPGELRARVVFGVACVLALAVVGLAGCERERAKIYPAHSMESVCARIFLAAIDSGRGLQPHDCKFFRDFGCGYQCPAADAGSAR